MPGGRVDVVVLVLELLLSLVHLGGGELQLLHDLLHGGVELLHLLAHVADHHLELVALLVAVLRLVLILRDLLVQLICLCLGEKENSSTSQEWPTSFFNFFFKIGQDF